MNKRYPQSLQNCLDDFKKSWEDYYKLSKINENWEKVIGLQLSKECKPLKVEQKILTIAVNHPQWRQALIYNKHRLKGTISRLGISLNEIKIIQNYEDKTLNRNALHTKIIWENHPSRIINNNMIICKYCNSPTPKGELSRWGKCSFCWRNDY